MCCRDYVMCIFAAIWSFVQTILHLAWCIWAVNFYNCHYGITRNTFKFLWYLTYFYSDSCVNVTVLDVIDYRYLGNETANRALNLPFPPQSAAADRTANIFSTYIVIDALWMVTALNLLIATLCRIRNQWALLMHFPWPSVLLILLFFDGVCAAWYGIDVSLTSDFQSWAMFIGIPNQDLLDEINIKLYAVSMVYPSILMMASVNAYQDFDDDASISIESRCY
ncbi:hypothetical protein PPYR_01884 [Photinus pyralis]|uniref:Uncharacterized protein n=1 Tax=Photinus pyralis TaxID=7054 RepID=A0A5N4B5T6_PHOPY|nr:uncharacterized protein LOC116159048 isoform X2 [Photinus pyralis]KAB0804914.1 hypothetical protein PPYR_01884 [Photinus pyralis]